MTSFRFSCLYLAMSRSVTRLPPGGSAMMNAPQLLKLPLPEIAIWQFGMGDGQRLVGERLAFDHHYVEVQCTRAPSHWPPPAGRPLDSLKRGQQHWRLERGLHHDHLVQISSLRNWSKGLCFLDRGFAKNPGVPDVRDRDSRPGKSHFTVAHIG